MKSSFDRVLVLFAAIALFIVPFVPAATFEVGPGKPYETISAVPWEQLSAGDIVLIHWRDTAYAEKWSISVDGTQEAPFVVRGVPGPNGELPMIDGNNAVTRAAMSYTNQARGVVRIGGADIPAVITARHIIIENLDIFGAHPSNAFHQTDGAVSSYSSNAAAIYVESAEHVVVRNCRLHGCANGLFSSSLATDLLVEGSHLFDNGLGGDAYTHNSYTSGRGVVFQKNHFGPLAAGALGNNLKDRSAGLSVRYNWIEGGNRQLDLVDSDNGDVFLDPRYGITYVYGNILIDPEGAGNIEIVHYGGDSGQESTYRKGALHFYNNTVVSAQQGGMILFRLSTAAETVDARNNIFYHSGSGPVWVLEDMGTANLKRNWLNEGWLSTRDPAGTGVINGGDTSLVGSSPGFVDFAAFDFGLSSASPCIDAGHLLAPSVYPDHVPVYEYVPHMMWRPRPLDSALDIGAYERPNGLVTDLVIETSMLPVGNEGSPYTASLTASGGIPPYAWNVSSGALPPGLVLDGETGAISGVPTSSGSFQLAVQAADSQNPADVATRVFVIQIAPIFTVPLKLDVTFYAQRNQGFKMALSTTAGQPPMIWSIAAGVLAPGLSLDASTGMISGRPRSLGEWSMTIHVVDSAGIQSHGELNVTIIVVKNIGQL